MSIILMHQKNPSYLIYNMDDGTCTETTDKKKATRFVTEASAIVVLEDSDFLGDYTPEFVRK